MIQVRAHTRRKPAKSPAYIEKLTSLRSDVALMQRGELPPYRRPGFVSSAAGVLCGLAEFILGKVR